MDLQQSDIKRLPWIIAGVVCAIVSMIPYFILGEDSIVTYHDQLDGELITYLLNAKHLFDGTTVYPELMNGISKNGVASPTPFFILFFKLFKPFTAFLVCMAIVRLVSVIFMFLFLDELISNKVISFILAVFFMLLPFYTVYGLCIPGQPVIYYSFLRFKKDRWEWPLYFAMAFYAACSSFALGGYAVVIVAGICLIISVIRNNHPLRYLVACLVLTIGYVLENLSLVSQAIGLSEGFVSHKSEMVRTGANFLPNFFDILLHGVDYTKAYQQYYLPVILLALIVGLIFIFTTAGEKDELESTYKKAVIGAIVIIITVALTAFIDCPLMTKFLNSKTGILHDFNFDRFSWLLTAMWIAELAVSLKVLWIVVCETRFTIFFRIVYVLGFTASVGAATFFAFYNNDLKPNVVKLAHNGDYYMMTWSQFFAEDLYSRVDELIGRENKSEFRVVSLGIYPAAAAYNGYYCLDAYSNNYDVNYKHEFHEVIAPQLEQSAYLTKWFDNWGNRCYIVINDNMNYFSVEKKWGGYTENYELNFDKLREMGCEYLIAAEYLIEPEKYGLTLLNTDEQAIETDDSWYRLFVYALN